ncbi:MAG: hypothetical protein AB7S26_29045 [Sandaracinaceae bacterium]
MDGFDDKAILAHAALIAATAVGLTLIVRRLPPVADWVAQGRKPFACNLCCATWTTLGTAVVHALATHDAWIAAAWLPAVAIATWALHHADPPPPPAFVLPDAEERASPDDAASLQARAARAELEGPCESEAP